MNQQELESLWNDAPVELSVGDPKVILENIQLNGHNYDVNSNVIYLPHKDGEHIKFVVVEHISIEMVRKRRIPPPPSDNVNDTSSNSLIPSNSSNAVSSSSQASSASCSVDIDSYYNKIKNSAVKRVRCHKRRRLSATSETQIINTGYSQSSNTDNDTNSNSNSNSNNNSRASIASAPPVSEPEIFDIVDSNGLRSTKFKRHESEVIAYKSVVNAESIDDTKDIKIGSCKVGTCALRLSAQLNAEGSSVGILLLVKYVDKRNICKIAAVEVPPLAVFFNNLKKFCQVISETICRDIGVSITFTPTITGADGDLDKLMGIAYCKRFLIPQIRKIRMELECVNHIGRTLVGSNVYIALPAQQIVDVKNAKVVSPLEAGIYLQNWVKNIKSSDYKHYPRIVENQTFDPLPDSDRVKLLSYIGSENMNLLYILDAMDLVTLIGWDDLITYGGGTNLILIIYGAAKSTKSWTLRFADAKLGINHFSRDPSELGQSKVILEDWTTPSLKIHCDRYRGFTRKCEDADRPGNKQKWGGAAGVVWASSGFGDSITKAHGAESGNNSGVAMTVNSTPEFLKAPSNSNKKKDDGTASRSMFWHHEPNHDPRTRTQKRQHEVNDGILPIAMALQQRSLLFLTKCKPQHNTIKEAGLWIDKIQQDIAASQPKLLPYIDSRIESNKSVLMAYAWRIAKKNYGAPQYKTDVAAGWANWAVKTAEFLYRLNENPVFLIEDKYQSTENIMEYLLFAFECANKKLTAKLRDREDNDEHDEHKSIEQFDLSSAILDLNKKQKTVLEKHLIILVQRDGKNLIGLNISGRLGFREFIKTFEFADKLLEISEFATFDDILIDDSFKKWKYYASEPNEWPNIIQFMSEHGATFSNQKEYKGIRVQFDKKESRFQSFITPPKLEPKWTALFGQYGKNGKATGKKQENDENNKKPKKKQMKKSNLKQLNDEDTKKVFGTNENSSETVNCLLVSQTSHHALLTLLNDIINDEACSDLFVEPVDINQFPSYSYISAPLCFNDIKSKINNNEYANDLLKFASDIRLVFSNAKEFNQAGSDIYGAACLLSDKFESKFLQFIVASSQQKPIKKSKINFNTNSNNSHDVGLRD